MRPFQWILLLSALLWSKTPLVAVGDLTPRGVSGSDAAIISDRLRAVLIQTGKVRVLERQEMDKILREQAFQQSGACDRSECAVQIGRLLAVDKMVVGTVGRLGEIHTLSVRILDVGSGEIVYSAAEDEPGSLEDLLTRAVPLVADRLADGAATSHPRAGAPKSYADLEVQIDDSTATLAIDGRLVAGRSPFFLERLEAGPHHLEGRTKTKRGTMDIVLDPDDIKKVSLALDTGTTFAKVFSTPSGAEVFLDDPSGRSIGTTPLKIDGIPIGPHRVTYRKSGYLDTTIIAIATMDQPMSNRCVLTAGGSITLDPVPDVPLLLVKGNDSITVADRGAIQLPVGTWRLILSHPAWEPISETFTVRKGESIEFNPVRHFGSIHILSDTLATIWLDDVARTRTPAILDSIEPGLHRIVLRTPGRADWVQEIHLAPGQVVSLLAKMESRFGQLGIRTSIPAEIELDSTPIGSTTPFTPPVCPGCDPVSFQFPRYHSWQSDTLAPGRRHLKVTAEKRVPFELDLILARGSRVDYDIPLPWTPEEIARQRAQSRTRIRILTGIATAATAATATYFAVESRFAADRADKLQTEYDNTQSGFPDLRNRYAQNRSEANGALTRSIVSGSLAILAATGFALTWVF